MKLDTSEEKVERKNIRYGNFRPSSYVSYLKYDSKSGLKNWLVYTGEI